MVGPVEQRRNAARHRRHAWSLFVGRIAGIDIRIHITFLFLLTFVAMAGTETGGPGLASSLIWLSILFGCVLAHELAHGLVARSRGIAVRAIVLLPIGGLSEMGSTPRSWQDELAISAAGPVLNLGLALLGTAVIDMTGGKLVPAHLFSGALLPRFVWANVVLGLFNLIPGFPLDGGRVLRAALERHHDEIEATEIVVLVGKVVSAALVVFGVFIDIWIAAIGAFMFFAGAPELILVRAHADLKGVRASDLMRTPVSCFDGRRPLPPPGDWMRYPQIVAIDGKYVGLLDRIPRRAVHTIAEAADTGVPTLRPDDDLGRSGFDTLIESGCGVLAVVDEQRRVVGWSRCPISWPASSAHRTKLVR